MKKWRIFSNRYPRFTSVGASSLFSYLKMYFNIHGTFTGDDAMDTDAEDVSIKFEPNEVEKSGNEGRDFRKYDSVMECEDKSNVKLESLESGSSEMKVSSTEVDGRIKKEDGELSKEEYKNPSAVVNQFKDMYTKCLNENIRIHQITTSLQESQHTMSLKVSYAT